MAQDYENVKMARATEQPAVRTTIVGGRPPGSGQPVGDIPRGMEVLVKKAAVDAGFRDVLLSRRAAAADLIGLTLDKTEAAMLAAIPAAQLEAIVGATRVPTKLHAVFMGAAAAAMLAALGAGAARAEDDRPYAGGAAPDEPTPVYPVAGIAPMSDDEMWLMNLKAPADAGAVAGVVTTFDGKALEAARVQIVGTTMVATTDADGRYFFERVAASKVMLTCSKDGYRTATRDGVEVQNGYVTSVNFGLTFEPGPETGARPDFEND